MQGEKKSKLMVYNFLKGAFGGGFWVLVPSVLPVPRGHLFSLTSTSEGVILECGELCKTKLIFKSKSMLGSSSSSRRR